MFEVLIKFNQILRVEIRFEEWKRFFLLIWGNLYCDRISVTISFTKNQNSSSSKEWVNLCIYLCDKTCVIDVFMSEIDLERNDLTKEKRDLWYSILIQVDQSSNNNKIDNKFPLRHKSFLQKMNMKFTRNSLLNVLMWCHLKMNFIE